MCFGAGRRPRTTGSSPPASGSKPSTPCTRGSSASWSRCTPRRSSGCRSKPACASSRPSTPTCTTSPACSSADPSGARKEGENSMGNALDELLALLELEALEVNLFRGLSPHEARQRVFGGQVAAQALVAAGRTVGEDRPVHSLHAYFLRPGDPNIPIVYDVDRIRDGKSFTTRRVVAIQHGRAIFNLAASFQIVENGPDHQMPMPTAPGPDELPTWLQRVEPYLERLGPDLAQWLPPPPPIHPRPGDDPRRLAPSTPG